MPAEPTLSTAAIDSATAQPRKEMKTGVRPLTRDCYRDEDDVPGFERHGDGEQRSGHPRPPFPGLLPGDRHERDEEQRRLPEAQRFVDRPEGQP